MRRSDRRTSDMAKPSAILNGFTRRLSTFFLVLTIVIWLLAIAIYFRSKYRSDVFTIITPGGIAWC